MRRTLALAGVVSGALLWAAAGSAVAGPPNYTAAERLCESQSGRFISTSGPFRDIYGCLSNDGQGHVPFTEQQARAAERLCARAYGGRFELAFDRYDCHIRDIMP